MRRTPSSSCSCGPGGGHVISLARRRSSSRDKSRDGRVRRYGQLSSRTSLVDLVLRRYQVPTGPHRSTAESGHASSPISPSRPFSALGFCPVFCPVHPVPRVQPVPAEPPPRASRWSSRLGIPIVQVDIPTTSRLLICLSYLIGRRWPHGEAGP
ncbi:hypothetical protein GGR56DRAFT_307124 [Xylariaceae sp. FL0804]|nr:hypothetical protein GGR56DRAFT_307124 [Xylariaceae sp. FL0804]